MTAYRVKLVFDFEAVDDAEARKRVEAFLLGIPLPEGFRRDRVNCVQQGDRSGRNVMGEVRRS